MLQFNCDRMYQPQLGWVLETSVLSVKKRKKVMPSFFLFLFFFYLWDLTCFSTYHGILKDKMEFEFVSTLTFSVKCLFEEEQQGYLEWGRGDRRLPIRWSLWPPSTAWVRRHFENVSLFSLYWELSLHFLFRFLRMVPILQQFTLTVGLIPGLYPFCVEYIWYPCGCVGSRWVLPTSSHSLKTCTLGAFWNSKWKLVVRTNANLLFVFKHDKLLTYPGSKKPWVQVKQW